MWFEKLNYPRFALQVIFSDVKILFRFCHSHHHLAPAVSWFCDIKLFSCVLEPRIKLFSLHSTTRKQQREKTRFLSLSCNKANESRVKRKRENCNGDDDDGRETERGRKKSTSGKVDFVDGFGMALEGKNVGIILVKTQHAFIFCLKCFFLPSISFHIIWFQFEW